MPEGSGDSHPLDRLGRQLTLTDATLLLVASVIGAGIFFTPGRIAELLPHPGWILAAWLVGALLSLAGALANAELATMFPRAGGDYVYLREGIHPVAGFLVGWLTFFAVYAGTIAALAAAFGEGLAAQFRLGEGAALAIAVGVTAGTSALNYVGARWGARANNITSGIKLLALGAFVVVGPVFGSGEVARLLPTAGAPDFEISASAFGLAMSPILFTFLGWNAAVYVGSEVRDPSRNLPRSLFLGLAICTGVYLLMNGVYLYALPLPELALAGDAGRAAAGALFGPVGGTLVAAVVLVSVLGTLNATVLVGPRIAYAMALDGLFFKGAEYVHEDFRTPTGAILLQGLVAVGLLLVLRSFPSALDFTTFAVVLATSADVLALYFLRWRQPDRVRPYRAWGYPLVPGLYLVANMAIAAAMVWGRPLECAIAVATLLAGLPFYFRFIRLNPAGARAE
jgi:APA family basic amino acid/polyamine antiporter